MILELEVEGFDLIRRTMVVHKPQHSPEHRIELVDVEMSKRGDNERTDDGEDYQRKHPVVKHPRFSCDESDDQ